jgi:hypothetical protein
MGLDCGDLAAMDRQINRAIKYLSVQISWIKFETAFSFLLMSFDIQASFRYAIADLNKAKFWINH